MVLEGSLGDVAVFKNMYNVYVNRDTLCRFSFRADVCPPVKSVKFFVNGNFYKTENIEPFVLTGDLGGKPYPWIPAAGSYTIDAIPYSKTNAGGDAGDAAALGDDRPAASDQRGRSDRRFG